MPSLPVKPSLPALALPENYGTVLQTIKEAVRQSRVKAHFAVNQELVLLYWGIGKRILEAQEKEGWGAKVIDRLALDLRVEFPGNQGFSPRNLKYMRAFAEAFPDLEIVQQAAAQIPWFHNCVLLNRVKSPKERLWYIQATLSNGWSRSILEIQLESKLFQRQALVEKSTNFPATLPKEQSDLVQQLLKDPYNLEFLGLTHDVEEQELHEALLKHLQRFLLELGAGFAFLGSHYRLNVAGEDFYPDRLFYHTHLKCYVVIELKMQKFAPQAAGQLNFYIAAIDGELRREGDNPTIGILLCKEKNQVVVEYALKGALPMGVSTFNLAQADIQKQLPTPEELARALESL